MTVMRPVWFIFLIVTSGLVMTSPAYPASLEDRLAGARLELEIGIATEQRIQRELESYRPTPEASPERIALYETYLDRVRQLTEEKRKVVQQLEQARRRSAAGNAPPPGTDVPAASLDVPEDQELDELRALQRELDQSIAAFDDMLLIESELARVQSERKMKQLAQEAAQAARSLREGENGEGEGEGEGSAKGQTGMEGGKSSSVGREQSRENTSQGGVEADAGDASQEDGSTESGEDRYRSQRKSPPSQGKESERTGKTSHGKSDTQDDDIVARQLREAAEKETDPVLKEKLWKEYYDYKKGH